MIKNAKDAGADNLTPSVPQYFSWINNTNEGATEEQTLINLDFFKYLKDTYGMQIRIYAWDAGNYDGASEGYGNVNSEKFRSQYPEGYKNVVKKAAEMGIRFGLWGSPDGFGKTPEEEKERFDFFVHLCKDYNFALFKLDGVCGKLRPEKAELFAQMLRECRKYSPDLIVLNHRLNLYEAEKHVTTYLWNGDETYVDILSCNKQTAMHHRGFMFTRGHTDNLERLAEDHGVCISSNIDYFEDELIYQAFNRSLVLAPEIYGNPWLMRDDELPRLAGVYNLHARNAKILVNGMVLSEEYGCNAVSRGSSSKRFISTGNNSWETKSVEIKIGKETGINTDLPVEVNIHHPYKKHLGTFAIGDTVKIELMPFRATLIELATADAAEPMLTNCEYEAIKEAPDGTPIEIKLLLCNSENIFLRKRGGESFFMKGDLCNIKEKAPVFIGELKESINSPENGEELYEAAMFAISNDSLEKRAVDRSGETKIPQVKAARDAFFGQEHYKLRGCESANMFDGNENTFFDSQSKTYCGNNLRINGGCLRVDFGVIFDCDTIEIDFFSADYTTAEVEEQKLALTADYSINLANWNCSDTVKLNVKNNSFVSKIIKFTKHTTYDLPGKILTASYAINGKLRYLRIDNPVDRIYSIRLIKDGKEIPLKSPKANNMQAHYRHKKIRKMLCGEFILPEYRKGDKLTVAAEGAYGDECFYCVANISGKLEGFPERAPDFKANQWEHCVCSSNENHTFFLPLPAGLQGQKVKIYAMFTQDRKSDDAYCRIYISPGHS